MQGLLDQSADLAALMICSGHESRCHVVRLGGCRLSESCLSIVARIPYNGLVYSTWDRLARSHPSQFCILRILHHRTLIYD